MKDLSIKDMEAIEYEFDVKRIDQEIEEPGLIEAFLIDTENLPEAATLIINEVEEWAGFEVVNLEEIDTLWSFSLITVSGGRQCADFYHALKAEGIEALYFNNR